MIFPWTSLSNWKRLISLVKKSQKQALHRQFVEGLQVRERNGTYFQGNIYQLENRKYKLIKKDITVFKMFAHDSFILVVHCAHHFEL